MISSTLLWFHYSTRLGFELVRVFIGGALYQRMVDVLESLDPEELGRRAARRDDVECR